MNYDGADGSATRGFFILIRPASVIGEGRAVEELWIVRRRLAREENNHFAAHVDARVVVPLVFGGGDAVADEDRFGIEGDVGLLLKRDADKIVQPTGQ